MEKQLADQLQCYDVLSVYQRVQTLALVTRLAERVPSMAAYASRIWTTFALSRGRLCRGMGPECRRARTPPDDQNNDGLARTAHRPGRRAHTQRHNVCLQEKRRIREHFEGVLEFCFDMESWESALRAVKLSDL